MDTRYVFGNDSHQRAYIEGQEKLHTKTVEGDCIGIGRWVDEYNIDNSSN